LQRLLDGVSPITLTARLRALDERELVARAEGTVGKASVFYSLTERGTAVLPDIQAISYFAAVNQ
jgi:DNA-binding HxlR family transcriptional regulator